MDSKKTSRGTASARVHGNQAYKTTFGVEIDAQALNIMKEASFSSDRINQQGT